MATVVWNLVKSGAKSLWKKSAKFIAGVYAGYEANEYIKDLEKKEVSPQPQPVYLQPKSVDDNVGANEIVIILMVVIVILLLIIILSLGGAKLVSYIGQKAVKRDRERN